MRDVSHRDTVGRMADQEGPFRLLTPISNPTLDAVRGISVQVERLSTNVTEMRSELQEVRAVVLGDHAPRVTALEQQRSTLARTGSVLALTGNYGMLTLGAFGLVSEALKLWKPSLAGPLDTVRQLLGTQ